MIVAVYEDYARDSRVRRHARALAAAGFEVTILALGDQETVKVAAGDGARLIPLMSRKYRGTSKASYVLAYARFALMMATRIIAALPTGLAAVWVNNPPDLLIFAALPARLRRVPIVLDVHDMSSDLYAAKFGATSATGTAGIGLTGRLVGLVERLALRLADGVLTVHVAYADRIRARVRSGIPVTDVLNVPDADDWIAIGDARDPRDRATTSRLVLGHHGTILERFGIDLAVRAVRRLVDDGLDVELRILGDGDYAHRIGPLVAELGLEKRVRHDRRAFRPEEVPGFLDGIDVLVAPYRRSPFIDGSVPVKVLEAVTLGVPVVVTSTTALRRYLGDDVIGYVNEPTIDALAAEIRRLADPGERAERWRRGRTAARSLAWAPQRERLLAWFRTSIEQ